MWALRLCAAQLRVVAPSALGGELGWVEGSTATFAPPFYGGPVQGELEYGASRGDVHCSAADYDAPPAGKGALRIFVARAVYRSSGYGLAFFYAY